MTRVFFVVTPVIKPADAEIDPYTKLAVLTHDTGNSLIIGLPPVDDTQLYMIPFEKKGNHWHFLETPPTDRPCKLLEVIWRIQFM